jgi:hypothetical protein
MDRDKPGLLAEETDPNDDDLPCEKAKADNKDNVLNIEAIQE